MLISLLLMSCTAVTTSVFPVCEVQLTSITPNSALPGEEVVLTATPLTETWDTAILIGGARAQVTTLSREGCDACDDCVATKGCDGCSDCDSCDVVCRTECVETVTFTVPELSPGPVRLELFNAHGGSEMLAFEVLGATPDSGLDDTGADDTGADDTGADDTGQEN